MEYTLGLPTLGVGNNYDAETKIISALEEIEEAVTLVDGIVPLKIGSDVASASEITPTGQIFHVTGTVGISKINLPYTGFTGNIIIIPDGIFSWAAAVNIAIQGTSVVDKPLTFTYDGAYWYPSYT